MNFGWARQEEKPWTWRDLRHTPGSGIASLRDRQLDGGRMLEVRGNAGQSRRWLSCGGPLAGGTVIGGAVAPKQADSAAATTWAGLPRLVVDQVALLVPAPAPVRGTEVPHTGAALADRLVQNALHRVIQTPNDWCA